MMTEAEIITQFTRLESHILKRWVAAGWLRPLEGEAGFLFDDADVARAHLLCDLSFDMDLADGEVAIVLSLVDRLNGTRTMLRALTTAVQHQPQPVRDGILSQMRALLGGEE
jgi:chaperone modulatory protein CbpM